MELLSQNLVLTATSMSVPAGSTATSGNLLTRDARSQWVVNVATGGSAGLRLRFDETVTVSRIALIGINWKFFNIQWNDPNTSPNGTFSLTSGPTNSASWETNSETSMFLHADAQQCTSVTFSINESFLSDSATAAFTSVAGYLGVYYVLSDLGGRIPSANRYRVSYEPMGITHQLADGTHRKQIFDYKYSAEIGLDYVTSAIKTELESVFDLHNAFTFIAFGTATGWDEVLFPCYWTNDFEFENFSSNNPGAGFSGNIRLAES